MLSPECSIFGTPLYTRSLVSAGLSRAASITAATHRKSGHVLLTSARCPFSAKASTRV